MSVETLKKAVLVFDEIVFVDSQPFFIRQELMKDLVPNWKLDETESVYRFLFREGVAKIIDPQKFLKKYGTLLTLSIIDDINDLEFSRNCINESVESWAILKERIPPSFLEVFYPGVGTFSEAISLQALLKANGDFVAFKRTFSERWSSSIKDSSSFKDWCDNWCDHIKQRWGNLSKEELWNKFLTRYNFVIGDSSHLKLPAYDIPFLQASSLRINEALLICANEGLTPFTDRKIHDRLLRLKTNRALRILRENGSLGEKAEIKLSSSLPEQYLSLSLLDRLIPRDDLKRRSVEDLVRYRKKNEPLLSRFREKISELSDTIALMNMDENYMKQVESLVSTRIAPEIRKIRDDLLRTYEDNFGQLLTRSVKVTVPTLIATIFAGLGFWEIIGVCALAEMGMLSTKGVDNLMEIWKAVRRSKRNGFAYLMELQNRARA